MLLRNGEDDGRDLAKVLRLHKMFVEGIEGGIHANLKGADLTDANLKGADLTCADLTRADLTRADLTCANLKGANLEGADLACADLTRADLTCANLKGADLTCADLTRADLTDADLTGANLDFSAFPLWCGGTRFKADDRLVAQVLAHLCSLDVSPETRRELDKILAFAKTSHRAQECGIADAVVPPAMLSQDMLQKVWHDGCVNGAGATPDFNALIEPFGCSVSKEAS